jgi:AraC-like DNA-binding protein
MLNVFEAIRATPAVRKFEIGDLLFAHVTCPAHDGWDGSWAQHDHLVHVISGKKTLRTSRETWTFAAGDTVFMKKGAYLLRQEFDTELCVLMFFVPDAFVRETVREVAAKLPAAGPVGGSTELAIPVQPDVALQAFLHAMTVFFAGEEQPSELLLTLKLRELVTALLLSARNRTLSAYLQSLAGDVAPSIPAIMEANCCHNLPLEAFAKMCHRSLSTFKREFRQHYGTSPGKWLLERRLACSAQLLRATNLSVTEIVFECGFEDASHFSHAFKEKYGQPPSVFRDARSLVV